MGPDETLLLARAILGAAYGLVFGSFATVLAARIPWSESIGGRSHCRTCAAQIRALDNIPVFSWLVLRGRCRSCGARIGWKYPAMEALSGALGAYVAVQSWSIPVLVAWMLFVPVAVALTFIDLELKRLPDALTLPAAGGALALLGVGALLSDGVAAWRGAVIGAVALSAFYLTLNLVSRGGMGMGDVKLALVIGALTGYFGWPYTVGAGFLAFLSGSIVSVALMLMGKAGRKSSVPFGPFMLLGTFAIIPLADWFASLLGF